MPLFDFYVMVDWSGATRHRGRRSDCIWIGHGPTEALRLNRTNGPPVQCSPG
jgi:hypothetical protein